MFRRFYRWNDYGDIRAEKMKTGLSYGLSLYDVMLSLLNKYENLKRSSLCLF